MVYSTFTVQSRALYAVDLMLEWRDCKGQWEHGSPWAVMHVGTRQCHMSAFWLAVCYLLTYDTDNDHYCRFCNA